MHNTVKYVGPTAKRQAIRDIISWLGFPKYVELTKEFRKFTQDQMPLERFEMYVHLAGVQGYPVRVWYNRVYHITEIGA